MTGNTLGWVIVAFVLYLLMMIAIGARTRFIDRL